MGSGTAESADAGCRGNGSKSPEIAGVDIVGPAASHGGGSVGKAAVQQTLGEKPSSYEGGTYK